MDWTSYPVLTSGNTSGLIKDGYLRSTKCIKLASTDIDNLILIRDSLPSDNSVEHFELAEFSDLLDAWANFYKLTSNTLPVITEIIGRLQRAHSFRFVVSVSIYTQQDANQVMDLLRAASHSNQFTKKIAIGIYTIYFGFKWNQTKRSNEGPIEHLKLDDPCKLGIVQIEHILCRFTIGTLEIYAKPLCSLLDRGHLSLLKPKRLIIHLYEGDLFELRHKLVTNKTRYAIQSFNFEKVELIFYKTESYKDRAVGMDKAMMGAACGDTTWMCLKTLLTSLFINYELKRREEKRTAVIRSKKLRSYKC